MCPTLNHKFKNLELSLNYNIIMLIINDEKMQNFYIKNLVILNLKVLK